MSSGLTAVRRPCPLSVETGGGRPVSVLGSPGVLRSYSSLLVMIPVQERQNLILAVGVQSRARAHWNIQATMIHCGHVSLDWRGENTWQLVSV